MRIAVWQASAEVGRYSANLTAIDHAAAEAASGGADVLVTPELFVTAYPPAQASRVSATDVTDALDQLSAIAARHDIALVASLPGTDNARPTIAAHLFSRRGELLSTHNKVHLFGPDEKAAFAAASAAPRVVSLEGVNVSMVICYDIEFPESARAAAESGANVILVPTALAGDYPAVPNVIIPARALENHVVVAYSNHAGMEGGLDFRGRSVIAGPNGEILAVAGESAEIIYADVDFSALESSREDVPYLRDRRAGLYRSWQTAGPADTHP